MNNLFALTTPLVALQRVTKLITTSTVPSYYTALTNWTPESWTIPFLSHRVFSRTSSANNNSSNTANSTSGGTIPPDPVPPKKDTKPEPPPPTLEELKARYPRVDDTIHQLLVNPALYDPVRRPRYPIVLCHGLYGFDVRGPSSFPKLQMHYWNNVLSILRNKVGAEVIVTSVPATGSVVERAEDLDRTLRHKAYGRGVNFMAHSMGGLDCRYLISRIKPIDYTPLSLLSISTPHRGSPFMDWCKDNIGLGRITASTIAETMSTKSRETKSKDGVASQIESSLTGSLASLPASFTNFLLSILDSPAYNNLTSSFCKDDFNTQTPDDPRVRYFSVAGRAPSVNLWHPLWLPKMVLDAWEKKERARLRELGDPIADNDSEWGNDGLVAIRSARWGEFLGTVDGCDHWEIRGARGIELDIDIPALQSVSLSIPSVNLHEWDWSNWLSAWRRDEGAAKVKALADEAAEVSSAAEKSNVKAEMNTGTLSGSDAESHSADGMGSDGTSSSEKLSTIFNWVAQNTPSTDALNKVTASVSSVTGGNKASNPEDAEAAVQGTNRKGERNELATKTDLERFYVALCRKLYDEGL